ncbi:MAG: FG-GAP-like repeat-containing protein [Acetobacteraceae bacterium]|nr:FG-GAP-like repeat-containing protein [Acetobacteraceae bacterium]
MASFVVPVGATQTTRISLSGTDDLTVQATGVVNVSANAQSVRFNAPTTSGLITNNGTIQNSAVGGRAIRVEVTVGANFTATINNNATGSITSDDDAIQIQAGSVTAGSLTLANAGSITSQSSQALDLAGGTGAFTAEITNSGTIGASANDAIRFGAVGNVTNSGTINGGTAAAYSVNTDGVQYEDNASGSVTNLLGGDISGDRHGINAGLGTSITVDNRAGATITGRNGSGVGADGSATVTNRGTITGAFSNSAGSDINGATPGQPNGGGPDGINDGDGDGVDADGLLTLDNYGLIQGIGAGGTGSDGLPNTSDGVAAGGGTIRNHAGATISGAGRGIMVDNGSTGPAPFATSITNQGTITGVAGIAIHIIGAQDDTVDNAGSISGGGGTAMLLGDGNDALVLRNGSTITGTSDGQGGTDRLDYGNWTGVGVVVSLAAGTATGTGGIAGFEAVNGSAQGDSLTGGTGGDTLSGGAGNDLLTGGLGDDALSGGRGHDTAVLSVARSAVTITKNAGAGWTVAGADGSDSLTGIERLQFTDQTINLGFARPDDVAGRGLPDMLFLQAATGFVWRWALDGSGQAGSGFGAVPTGWTLAGRGDLDGNGTADLIWRAAADGSLYGWLHAAGGTQSGAGFLATPAANETLAGMGDTDGDGRADLVVFNATAGTYTVRRMDGTTALGSGGGTAPTGMALAAVADFDGDLRADFLWRDAGTGAMTVWLMNGAQATATRAYAVSGAGTTFHGVGDLNGDGRADVLVGFGANHLWGYLTGTDGAAASQGAAGTLGTGWRVARIADATGDDKADIIAVNDATGLGWQQAMDGLAPGTGTSLGAYANGWAIL